MEPPSTFNPLARWFTNEKDRELDETRQLYAWVKARQDAFTETKVSVGRRVFEHFDAFPEEIGLALGETMYDLLSGETYIWDLPTPSFGRMSMKEFVEYRNLLHAKQYFFTNKDEYLRLIHETLVRLLFSVGHELPQTEAPSPFTIPLIYALPNPALSVEQTYGTISAEELFDRGIFRAIMEQFHRNVCAVSGRNPDDRNSKKPIKHATDCGLPLDKLADQYLAHTPFKRLFATRVPLKLSHTDRFDHMHIVGGTGAGKTTLIENLILHDLQSKDSPSLVIVDPHGDLIRKLSHADLGIEDRLIIIDPRDIEFPPALNVFAVNRERLAHYDEATREQVISGVIQTFDYLFSGLVGADLTAKQGVFFKYIARLMLSLPETMGRNATILDMLHLMSDPTPYQAAIANLPEIPRDFFTRDFMSKTFAQTKEQIRYRLQAILENPTIARLFTSPETKIDLFTEMNRGSIILVDTAKDYLKGASSNFGRIFISLVLQAVLERAAQPEHERKDTFLIVDEAASYFDSNIDDLLTDARKYKCGCVFAHQYLDQASSSLRASLAANTGAKFASGLSASDARAMSSDMRTTPDFILNQPRLQFAAHFRNITPHAVSIPVQPGVFADLPTLSPHAYSRLMDSNRERVSLPRGEGARPSARNSAPPVSPGPDEDISREW